MAQRRSPSLGGFNRGDLFFREPVTDFVPTRDPVVLGEDAGRGGGAAPGRGLGVHELAVSGVGRLAGERLGCRTDTGPGIVWGAVGCGLSHDEALAVDHHDLRDAQRGDAPIWKSVVETEDSLVHLSVVPEFKASALGHQLPALSAVIQTTLIGASRRARRRAGMR